MRRCCLHKAWLYPLSADRRLTSPLCGCRIGYRNRRSRDHRCRNAWDGAFGNDTAGLDPFLGLKRHYRIYKNFSCISCQFAIGPGQSIWSKYHVPDRPDRARVGFQNNQQLEPHATSAVIVTCEWHSNIINLINPTSSFIMMTGRRPT